VFSCETKRFDESFAAQIQNEQDHLRNPLDTVVSEVISLTFHKLLVSLKLSVSRGLPFRGRDEKIGSKHIGNFLGTIEFLALYDTFLADHIHRFANAGTGTPSHIT